MAYSRVSTVAACALNIHNATHYHSHSHSHSKSVQTYLDKVVEEHSSHRGQGEPDEDGKCWDIGNVQRMQQMRTDNRGRLTEQERHEEALKDVPGYFRWLLWQRRDRTTAQRGASRGAALMKRKKKFNIKRILVEDKLNESVVSNVNLNKLNY